MAAMEMDDVTAADLQDEIDALRIAIDRGGHSTAARNRLIEDRLELVRLQWELYVSPQIRKSVRSRLFAMNQARHDEMDAKYAARGKER